MSECRQAPSFLGHPFGVPARATNCGSGRSDGSSLSNNDKLIILFYGRGIAFAFASLNKRVAKIPLRRMPF